MGGIEPPQGCIASQYNPLAPPPCSFCESRIPRVCHTRCQLAQTPVGGVEDAQEAIILVRRHTRTCELNNLMICFNDIITARVVIPLTVALSGRERSFGVQHLDLDDRFDRACTTHMRLYFKTCIRYNLQIKTLYHLTQ